MTADRRLMLEMHAAKVLRGMLLGVTDDEDTIRDMVEGETSLREAIQGVLADIEEDEILIVGLKAKIEELTERRKRHEDRVERREEAILQAMQLAEVPKLTYPEATISTRRVPPGLLVECEAKIPAQFWKPQNPVLDKNALKSTLNSGKSVEGAKLSNGGVGLTIRRR